MKTNETGTEKKITCPECQGFAIRTCPWCKVDVRDEEGKVIRKKRSQGCRACLGVGVFTCTKCNGKGYILQGEIEIPETP